VLFRSCKTMPTLFRQRHAVVEPSNLKFKNDGSLKPVVDSASSTRSHRTLAWLEIPEWQRDNEYILTGYRRVQNSWEGCRASVFGYLHNESINIHSHLWGAVIFAYFLATFQSMYISRYPSTSWVDTFVFAIFLLSAIFCLAFSAVFHMSTCHSKNMLSRCQALDYSGIAVLIVGSFYPCIYYGFFCEPHFQIIYLLSITLIGMATAYIVLNPEYAKSTHRGARTKVFIFLGLSSVFPVVHTLVSHGLNKVLVEMGFGWLLASGALYIAGALIYANRIPERWHSGRFDYFFASHQIFHVHVVLAALAHYACVVTAFNHWHSDSSSCEV